MIALELWAEESIECSELSGLFCGSLEDKNIKSSTGAGGLASEVSKGNAQYCKDSVVLHH